VERGFGKGKNLNKENVWKPPELHRIKQSVWYKGKVCSRIGHEVIEREQRHSSTLSLTSALGGVGV
jgi:hypothetical protein